MLNASIFQYLGPLTKDCSQLFLSVSPSYFSACECEP
ncbi:unnamed protein product [Brassica oleracea]